MSWVWTRLGSHIIIPTQIFVVSSTYPKIDTLISNHRMDPFWHGINCSSGQWNYSLWSFPALQKNKSYQNSLSFHSRIKPKPCNSFMQLSVIYYMNNISVVKLVYSCVHSFNLSHTAKEILLVQFLKNSFSLLMDKLCTFF